MIDVTEDGQTLVVTRPEPPPALLVRGGRDRIVSQVGYYGAALNRAGDRLRPPVVTLVWLYALHEAGVPAKKVRQYDMVIEMPCPYDHLRPDGRSLATIRLLVRPDGWVSIDAESECPSCTGAVIERWLVTCPRCEADEESEEHYLGKDDENDPFIYHLAMDHARLGDDSPLAFVVEQFALLHRAVLARWDLAHPEEVRARTEADAREFPALYRGREEQATARRLAAARVRVEEAEAVEAALRDRPRGSSRGKARTERPRGPRTVEETIAWLDSLLDSEGNPAVPPDASYRAAQRAANLHDPRPTQSLIREAQPLRRARSAEASGCQADA